MNDTLLIADFLDADAESEWLDYPDIPGFRVLIAPPDNPAQVRAATRVLGIADILDQSAAYHFRKVQEYVAGWEGLTVADLPKLFPGKNLKVETAGEEDSGGREFACTPENLEFLLKKSGPFYRWLNAQANAREVVEAADRKNS